MKVKVKMLTCVQHSANPSCSNCVVVTIHACTFGQWPFSLSELKERTKHYMKIRLKQVGCQDRRRCSTQRAQSWSQTSSSLNGRDTEISILAITGSSTVIPFLNLMANRKAETICVCLHFSCYMMVAWCLHEHVATLRNLFPPVRESVMHFFFLSTSWSSRPHNVTKHDGNVNLRILNMSCLQRYCNCSMTLESSRPQCPRQFRDRWIY